VLAREREGLETMDEIAAKVVACLTEVGVDWCLVGAHAVNEYTEPRATTDFDFLIDDRKLLALKGVLERELGDLDCEDIGAAVRLRAISVDLIKARSDRIFREVLETRVRTGDWYVPRIEALLVLKFLAGTSRWRGLERRCQDVLDLIRLYKATDPDRLDRDFLRGLSAQVYPGAERELEDLLGKADRGDPITI
jgi:hypothetical protein